MTKKPCTASLRLRRAAHDCHAHADGPSTGDYIRQARDHAIAELGASADARALEDAAWLHLVEVEQGLRERAEDRAIQAAGHDPDGPVALMARTTLACLREAAEQATPASLIKAAQRMGDSSDDRSVFDALGLVLQTLEMLPPCGLDGDSTLATFEEMGGGAKTGKSRV